VTVREYRELGRHAPADVRDVGPDLQAVRVAAEVWTWGRDTRMTDAEIIAALEIINQPSRRLLGAFLMKGNDQMARRLLEVILDVHSDGPAASGIAALTELLDTDPGAREHVAEIIQEIDPVARHLRSKGFPQPEDGQD
jgi:hypothetical protein